MRTYATWWQQAFAERVPMCEVFMPGKADGDARCTTQAIVNVSMHVRYTLQPIQQYSFERGDLRGTVFSLSSSNGVFACTVHF